MSAPFDIPLSFDALDGFVPTIRPLADGLRASTASRCISCAVIEYLDSSDERVLRSFNPGVGAMGHALHQWWAHQSFADVDYTVELPIRWAHGVSHEDIVVLDGAWAGFSFEVKTHSNPKPKPPSADNIAQVKFRARLRERAEMPTVTHAVVMIGKAGNESGWIRGPWNVELTDDDRKTIDNRLAIIDALMQRADTLDLHTDKTLRAAGCTRCFPKPRVDATPNVSDAIDRIAKRAAEARAQKDADTADRERVKRALANHPDAILEGIWGDASLTKTGALRITPRNDAPWDNA